MAAYDPEAKKRFSESVTWLSNVPFPLLDSLEACKDAPLEFLMTQLVLEGERMSGSGEITFGPPVAEERNLPNSLLEKITSRPRAIATYKDLKNRKYGKVFDFSGATSSSALEPVSQTGVSSGAGTEFNPSAPLTGPKGDDVAQRDLEYDDNELFDSSVLDHPEDPAAEKPLEKPLEKPSSS